MAGRTGIPLRGRKTGEVGGQTVDLDRAGAEAHLDHGPVLPHPRLGREGARPPVASELGLDRAIGLAGEAHGEGGTGAGPAFHPDGAAVGGDHLADDVEPEAQAAVVIGGDGALKGAKIHSWLAAAMPMPWSRTARVAEVGSESTITSIGLPAPNLVALVSRLPMACRIEKPSQRPTMASGACSLTSQRAAVNTGSISSTAARAAPARIHLGRM